MSLNVGHSSTIETLLESKFQPTRTVVLSFGFDEESSGFHVSHDLIIPIQFRIGALTKLIIRVLASLVHTLKVSMAKMALR
jgi:hypothetical protein